MLLTKKEMEIVEKSFKDYEFMKYACEKLITKQDTDYDNDKIADIISKIKGTDVYCTEDGYIDFYYNGLSLCYYNHDDQHYLSSGLSIWNSDTEDYIYECGDYNCIKNDLFDNRDDNAYYMLSKAIDKLRKNKSNNISNSYLKKEIVNYIEDRF